MSTLLLLHSCHTLSKVNAPIEDESAPFGARGTRAEDLSESDCIPYFRFRKEHLQLLAHELGAEFASFSPKIARTRVRSARMAAKCHLRPVF